MARQARMIVPGLPHHVTQRGNRRETVFLKPGDEAVYPHQGVPRRSVSRRAIGGERHLATCAAALTRKAANDRLLTRIGHRSGNPARTVVMLHVSEPVALPWLGQGKALLPI